MNSSQRMAFCILSDPYRARGTTYLHGNKHGNDPEPGNPTGAVVYPISVATTFVQSSPGLATAPDDPNSFGKGYEYSRTGTSTPATCYIYEYHQNETLTLVETIQGILPGALLNAQWLLPKMQNTA